MYSRKANRLKDYDYSQSGYYFVTICVNKFRDVWGEIYNGKSYLNDFGYIVEQHYQLLPKRFPNIELDQYIIMPNHMHSIIKINNPNHVGTTHELSPEQPQNHDNQQQKSCRNNLSTVVGYFKMNSSRDIHNHGLKDFKWQRSFYDRIIRNERELYFIRRYIKNNPLKWEINN